MKHCIILVLFCIMAAETGYAQAEDKEKTAAVSALKKMAAVYKNSAYLSFDVAYYYADEQSPAVYLDSLRGQFKVNGSNYWYQLDNTEFVSNNQYVVVLYKEDNLMYLSRPSAATQAVNPVAMVDSFLVHNDSLLFHHSISGGLQHVSILFPGKGMYKSMQYDVDVATGLLSSMRSIVRSDQLIDPALRSTAQNTTSYAIVEVRFSRYRNNSFTSDVFDMSRYFKKEGSEYHSVSPYNQYKIFVGTPNL